MASEQELIYIQEHMKQLTKQEQLVAQYIVQFPETVIEMSAQTLGEQTKTSSATVIRCVHKLGYKGLVELKLALSRYLPSHLDSVYQEIAQDATPHDIKRTLFSRAEYTLKTTESLLEDQALMKVINDLNHCRKLIVFGMGASHLVAEDIFQKFTRAGMQVVHSTDAHIMATVLADAQKGTVLMGISNSGCNRETLKLIKVAKHYGVTVIGMTSRKESELAKLSDTCLIHGASSERSLRLAATSSLLAQLMTVDTLFYTYLAQDYARHLEHLSHTKEAVDLYNDED